MNRTYFGRRFFVFWIVGFVATSLIQQIIAAEPKLKRWAIIASKELRDVGLSDLVAAQLSDVSGIELVEREQIDLVTKELELAALAHPDNAAKRLVLGRFLSADAIILIDVERFNDRPFLRVIISETRNGARLWIDYLDYSTDDLVDSADNCHRAVIEVGQRFPCGVQHVVALPDFQVREDGRESIQLEYGLSYLLAGAIRCVPGIAVVDPEEAHSIRRLTGQGNGPSDMVEALFVAEARALGLESTITKSIERDFASPLSIEGEVQVSAAQPSTNLTIRLKTGETHQVVVDRQFVSAADLTKWMAERAVREILAGIVDDDYQLPAREELLEDNLDRARAFSRVGAFGRAVGNREAVLLLDPDNDDQRISLVVDSSFWLEDIRLQHAAAISDRSRPERTDEVWHADNKKRRNIHYRSIVDHMERLVRRRALNPIEVNCLMDRVSYIMGRAIRPQEGSHRETKEMMDDCFWRIYSRIDDLDYSLRDGRLLPQVVPICRLTSPSHTYSPASQYQRWTDYAVRYVTSIAPRITHCHAQTRMLDDSDVLEHLFRLITHQSSRGRGIPYLAQLLHLDRGRSLVAMIQGRRVSIDEVSRFLDRLEATEQPLNVWYARCGRVSLNMTFERERPHESDRDEVESLIAEIRSRPEIREYAAAHRQRLEKTRESLSDKPASLAASKTFCNPLTKSIVPRRVSFEPIGEIVPRWSRFAPCGNSTDVAWSGLGVFLLRPGSQPARIFEIKGITDVTCDGKLIWIAVAGKGVYVLSPAGKLVGHALADDGFPMDERCYILSPPPHARGVTKVLGVVLHPVSIGRVIAIGRTGTQQRNWFAMLSLPADKLPLNELDTAATPQRIDVNVFHTASRVPNNPTDVFTSEDAAAIFDLDWMLECPVRGKSSRRLLIGRGGRMSSANADKPHRPLAIDLDSLSVDIGPEFHLSSGCRPRYADREGRMVAVGHFACQTRKMDAASGGWKTTTRYNFEFPYAPRILGTPFLLQKKQVLQHDGNLYVPGRLWHIIDPESLEPQRLTSDFLPLQNTYQFYARSSCFGLVAWNTGDRLYRIRISDEPEVETDLAVRYPYVPPEHREKHHRAIEAIEQLGGHVDALWGRSPAHEMPVFRRRSGIDDKAEYRWRTIAILSDEWQGGDEGLQHLCDLHEVSAVFLVGTPVTDNGMARISGLARLETLQLLETRVTDAGLKHIGQSSSLVHLRLAGSEHGAEFTDEGLHHLVGLSKLQELDLYGRHFTDAAVDSIKSFPRLRELWIVNTMLSREAREEIRTSREPPMHMGDEPWLAN